MDSVKRNPHKDAELIEIFKHQGIDEEYFPRFLEYYKDTYVAINEDYKDLKDEDFDEGDSVQESALFVTNLYITAFLEEMEKGHDERWCHLFADSAEDGEKRVYRTYKELYSQDRELARSEIQKHCKFLGGDEHFTKHYLYLFAAGDGMFEPEEEAKEYSKIYKEQLANGKTAIFAHEFASWMANGNYHEIFCEEYAYAYDKAISENKSEAYAREFANKYGSVLVDIKRRAGISDDEEMIAYNIEKVNAYMKAWEYVEKHPMQDNEQFIKIYEHIYLNTYFSDLDLPEESTESLDKRVLEKALLQFNKHK